MTYPVLTIVRELILEGGGLRIVTMLILTACIVEKIGKELFGSHLEGQNLLNLLRWNWNLHPKLKKHNFNSEMNNRSFDIETA